MTAELAIDYAWFRPNLQKVYDAGYRAILRYFGHDITKCLTAPECQQAHATNLGVGAVFEDGAMRAMSGAAGGKADAEFANDYADRIGWPRWKPIGYAVDFQATAAQMPTVLAYVEAADATGPRKAFGYGSTDVVDSLVAAGIPDDWQTCAWSHGLVNNKAAIYQRLRPTTGLQGSFDEDVILHPSNDIWWPNEQPPMPAAPTPTPAPPALKASTSSELDLPHVLLVTRSDGAVFAIPEDLSHKEHVGDPTELAALSATGDYDVIPRGKFSDTEINAIPDA